MGTESCGDYLQTECIDSPGWPVNVVAQDQIMQQILIKDESVTWNLMKATQRLRESASHRSCREQSRSDQEFREDVFRTFTSIRNELAARQGAFDQLKGTILHHHQGNLQFLSDEQEALKRQVQNLHQCRQEDARQLNDFVRLIRENKEDLEDKSENSQLKELGHLVWAYSHDKPG